MLDFSWVSFGAKITSIIFFLIFYRKSTLSQFSSPEQMFDTWLSDNATLSLSAFGTRRLFDALKKAMWATNKKSLETELYLKITGPSLMQQKCPRCTRFHVGGADTCKSRNMVSTLKEFW